MFFFVDDVITTRASLEAYAHVLLSARPGASDKYCLFGAYGLGMIHQWQMTDGRLL